MNLLFYDESVKNKTAALIENMYPQPPFLICRILRKFGKLLTILCDLCVLLQQNVFTSWRFFLYCPLPAVVSAALRGNS